MPAVQLCLLMLLPAVCTAQFVPPNVFRVQTDEEHAQICDQLGVPHDAVPKRHHQEDALAFAMQMRAKSTAEEQQILLTILKDSEDWHPDAPSLLRDVLARERIPASPMRTPTTQEADSRRLTSSGCSDAKDEAACALLKNSDCRTCQWDSTGSTPSCGNPHDFCSSYKTEEECCANAHNVSAGCMWYTEGSSTPWCTDYSCSEYKSSRNFTGYSCSTDVNCKESATSSCEDKVETSTSTNLGGGGECVLTDCSKCLAASNKDASGEDVPKTCAETRDSIKSGGSCESQCSDVAHCDEEVDCVLFNTKATDPCGTNSCSPAVPHPSCAKAAKQETTTTTTGDAAAQCGKNCNDVNTKCQSCGAKTCAAGGGSISAAHSKQSPWFCPFVVAPFAAVVVAT